MVPTKDDRNFIPRLLYNDMYLIYFDSFQFNSFFISMQSALISITQV